MALPERGNRKTFLKIGVATLVGAALSGSELFRRRNNSVTQRVTNDFVSGANDYDKEKVRKDAEEFKLSPEFEALDNPADSLQDHVSNDLVAGANEYDHDAVARAAAGFQLDPEWEAVPDPRTENEQAK